MFVQLAVGTHGRCFPACVGVRVFLLLLLCAGRQKLSQVRSDYLIQRILRMIDVLGLKCDRLRPFSPTPVQLVFTHHIRSSLIEKTAVFSPQYPSFNGKWPLSTKLRCAATCAASGFLGSVTAALYISLYVSFIMQQLYGEAPQPDDNEEKPTPQQQRGLRQWK